MSQAAEVSRRAEIGNTSEPTASAGLDQSEPAPHATAAKAGATAPPTPENELGLGALDPGLASAQSDIESGPESGSEFDSESKSGSDQNLLTPEITGGALAVAEAASSRALPAAPEENGRADDAAAAFADSALQEAVASAASPDANPAAQVSVAPARAEAEVATVTSAGAIKTADAQIDSSTPPVGLTAGVAPAGDIATAPATALAPDRPSIRVTRLETEIRRGFWTWILASFLRFWRRAPSARVRTGPVEIPLRLALEKCVSDWAASAEPPGEAGLHSIAPTSAWFEIDSHIFSGHLIATPTNEPSARLATEQMLARLREELGRELQSFGGEPRTGSVRAMKLDPVDWSQWLPAAAAVQATVRIDATLSFELGLIPFSQDERATNRQTFDQETYQPFFLEELKVNEPLDFDVFLHLPKNEKFVRYLKRGRVLKLPEKQKLLDRGAHQVHLRFGDEISLAAFRARRRLNQSIAQSIADTVANSEKRSGAKTEINPVAKIS